jgi:hypothetical protein
MYYTPITGHTLDLVKWLGTVHGAERCWIQSTYNLSRLISFTHKDLKELKKLKRALERLKGVYAKLVYVT